MVKAKTNWNYESYLPTIEYKHMGQRGGTADHVKNIICLNVDIMLYVGEPFIERTVVHEFAHIVANRVFGRSGRGHGLVWRRVMLGLGATNTDRCHTYPVKEMEQAGKLKIKRQRRWKVHCGCEDGLEVTTQMLNKMRKGRKYSCRICRKSLWIPLDVEEIV